MALTKCRDCGQRISKRAASCPSCGAPVKQHSSAGCGCLVICLLAGFFIYVALDAPKPHHIPVNDFKQGVVTRNDNTATPSPVVDSVPSHTYVTVGGYFASPSEELFEKASRYVADGDDEALAKLLATGDVIRLQGGIPVELVTTGGFLASKVKIRPRGQTVELWTFLEAIKPLKQGAIVPKNEANVQSDDQREKERRRFEIVSTSRGDASMLYKVKLLSSEAGNLTLDELSDISLKVSQDGKFNVWFFLPNMSDTDKPWAVTTRRSQMRPVTRFLR